MFSRAALSWLMLPVYIWQGIKLRMNIERLLPARLPVEGTIEGTEPPLNLLVIGDSTVASVGMENIEDTFAYAIAQAMAKQTGATIYWRAAGANSATSGDLRDHVVPHIEKRDWTHIVLSCGTNDMKNFHLTRRFKREFGTLIYTLKTRFPAAHVIWTPIPDMRKFPALSKMLGAVLAARADIINAKGIQLCLERGITPAPVFPIEDATGFARDGFHPNGHGFRLWAAHLAPALCAHSKLNKYTAELT